MIFNYIRVSTTDQNTERQLRNIDCDREFVEYASAKNTDRPELQKLLMMIRENDHINIHELSRLARNTQDLLNIVQQILDKKASIKFHKENLHFSSDRATDAFQKLMLSMLASISTFERDLLLERQREGIAVAKSNGKYKGRVSRFTPEQIDEIKSRFKQTKNKSALAKELKISRGYLYKLAS